MKKVSAIPFLLLVLILSIIIALSMGSHYIPFTEILFSNKWSEIIYSIRLPRIVNAISVGGLLSLAGLLIQNLVKNPLADPYILGISGASASVQLAVIALGFTLPFWLFVTIGFVAALLSLALLLFLSSRRTINTQNLLLSGVVIAFAYGAIISMILTLSPAASTKPMLFWLMGDLSYSTTLFYPIIILVIGSIGAYKYHKELDLLARGEFFALKSGVNVKKINLVILLTTSVFTAVAVSMAGTIGFVGLVVPHLARLLVGNVHARLIPLSALIGAIILLLADTLARTVFAPIQLPVGVFTAFFGVPVFIYLLRNRT
jgi:iron complex transport system permease protein